MIADDGLDMGPTSLVLEGREVLVAIELVASGGARRVVVAGLAHAAEVATRLAPYAALDGVMISRLVGEGGRASVLVRQRPVVVA